MTSSLLSFRLFNSFIRIHYSAVENDSHTQKNIEIIFETTTDEFENRDSRPLPTPHEIKNTERSRHTFGAQPTGGFSKRPVASSTTKPIPPFKKMAMANRSLLANTTIPNRSIGSTLRARHNRGRINNEN